MKPGRNHPEKCITGQKVKEPRGKEKAKRVKKIEFRLVD